MLAGKVVFIDFKVNMGANFSEFLMEFYAYFYFCFAKLANVILVFFFVINYPSKDFH